jgi:hypothetical protein
MADQDTVPGNTIPPKVSPFAKTPGTETAPAGTPAPASPRRTSRIPLAGVVPPAEPQPPTIRIKTVAAPAVGGTQPAADDTQVQAAKSKTSRISLDAAIGLPIRPTIMTAQPSDDGAPKTIRLKRPTEMPTVKVAITPKPAAAQATPAAAQTVKAQSSTAPIAAQAAPPSQTARIAEPSLAADAAPITQKRTIRVKRPGSIVVGGGVKADASEDGEASAETPAAGMTPIPLPAPDTAHALFIVAAIFAILLSIGLMIVYASQIFGPNESLTELSVWTTGPDFPLPGTVSGN